MYYGSFQNTFLDIDDSTRAFERQPCKSTSLTVWKIFFLAALLKCKIPKYLRTFIYLKIRMNMNPFTYER